MCGCGCADVWMCGEAHIFDCVCGGGCVAVDVTLYVWLYMCGCEIAVATTASERRFGMGSCEAVWVRMCGCVDVWG